MHYITLETHDIYKDFRDRYILDSYLFFASKLEQVPEESCASVFRYNICHLLIMHIVFEQEKPLICVRPLNMFNTKLDTSYIQGFALHMFRDQ